MNPVTLADYPKRVAEAESAVLAAQQGARALAAAVELRRTQFKDIVAKELPKGKGNDSERKNLLAELELTDEQFLELQTQHQAAKDAVVMAQIEADRQVRLWQVARIEAEGAVVQARRLGALEY